MRLGVSSFAYRYAAADVARRENLLAAAEHVLARSAAQGAQVVQFCENVPLDALAAGERAALAARAAQLGVAVEVGTRGIDVAVLRRCVEIASEVGSRALRVVPGTDDVRAIESAFAAIGPDLARAGIPLAIENHADLPAGALAALIQRLGGRAAFYGACLDSANSLGLLERPLETASTLGPLAVQVHIKDYAVEPARVGYRITGRRMGEGWLDLPGLAALLGPRLADLDVLVEQWMKPADDEGATRAQEEAWVAHNLARARAWAQRAVQGRAAPEQPAASV